MIKSDLTELQGAEQRVRYCRDQLNRALETLYLIQRRLAVDRKEPAVALANLKKQGA